MKTNKLLFVRCDKCSHTAFAHDIHGAHKCGTLNCPCKWFKMPPLKKEPDDSVDHGGWEDR